MASILIVDDDAELLRALTFLLSSKGHRVVTAQDGIMATSQAHRIQPNLIILDIGLPGGSGFAVLERIRASGRLAAIPVLVLSGSTEPGIQERAMGAGAQMFLHKPADPPALLAAVEQLARSEKAA